MKTILASVAAAVLSPALCAIPAAQAVSSTSFTKAAQRIDCGTDRGAVQIHITGGRLACFAGVGEVKVMLDEVVGIHANNHYVHAQTEQTLGKFRSVQLDPHEKWAPAGGTCRVYTMTLTPE